jgi:hypothetical protein
MAQRVNLSPIGLPIRKKTFVAKTESIIVIIGRYVFTIDKKDWIFDIQKE